MRVLGYHRREVATVLLGELALLVVMAVPLGCVLGNGLARVMTASVPSLPAMNFATSNPFSGSNHSNE